MRPTCWKVRKTFAFFQRLGLNEEIAVLQKLQVLNALIMMPLVHHLPIHIDHGRVVPGDGAEDRIPFKGALRFVGQSDRAVCGPGHRGSCS